MAAIVNLLAVAIAALDRGTCMVMAARLEERPTGFGIDAPLGRKVVPKQAKRQASVAS